MDYGKGSKVLYLSEYKHLNNSAKVSQGMLDQKSIAKIKEELDNCKNPLFFFDDDADGLSSFLLLYRYKQEGHGIVVKAKPSLNTSFLPKVNEYDPDKIFVVDVPVVDQEFIDAAHRPVVWIDHHDPVERQGVSYFNPRSYDHKDQTCITRICYEVVKQDIWIAAVGAIADWQMPEFLPEVQQKYPGLATGTAVGDIYFTSRLGILIKVFSFILKGNSSEVAKCFKILTRIDDPEEILQHQTPAGNYLLKRFEKVNGEYEQLLQEGLGHSSSNNELVFIYQENRNSFTGDLANELKYRFPDKLVVVGREKSGEVRMSLRCDVAALAPAVQKALVGIDGYGGGHEHACGAAVKKHDFERFLENLRTALWAKR